MRRSALRLGWANNLKLIGVGLLNYHDVYSTFPPAIIYDEDGTPMHSWRMLILPTIAGNVGTSVLRAYDLTEGWNSPKNRRLGDDILRTSVIRSVYQCPATRKSYDQLHTNYLMLIDDLGGKPNSPPNRPGSVPPRFRADQVIVVAEIADAAVHWMEPRDVLLSELSFTINDRKQTSISSCHGGGFIAYADGTIEFLDDNTTKERIEKLLTRRPYGTGN